VRRRSSALGPIKWSLNSYPPGGWRSGRNRLQLRSAPVSTLFTAAFVVFLLITALPGALLAQSGRRRPPVPTTETAPPPPPPVTVPESTVVTKQEQIGDISQFGLRNGMTVIVNEMHALPLVTVLAYVKLGRAEGLGLETARALEYALAGATESRPAGGIARDIARLGGLPASSSSVDHTVFALTAPSSGLFDALSIQADMIQHPKLDPDGVARAVQHAALYEGERCGDPTIAGFDHVSRWMSQSGHPHGPAGSSDWTGLINRDRVAEFYSEHYRPENLIVTITGDVTTFETLVQVERLYGQFGAAASQDTAGQKAGEQLGGSSQVSPHTGAGTAANQSAAPASPPPEAMSVPPPPQPELQFEYGQRRDEGGQAVVTVGCLAPGFESEDWPAMYVLSSLLGQGRGSLLSQTLLIEQGVVGHVESNYQISEQDGVLAIQMDLSPGSLDKAESGLFKQVADLLADGPRTDDLARAKSRAELSFQGSVSGYSDRATTLASLAAADRPAALPIDYIDMMRAATADDIKRVARKYLTIDNISVDECVPSSTQVRTLDDQAFRQMVLGWAPPLKQTQAKAKTARTATKSEKPNLSGPQPLRPDEQQEVDIESIQPLPVRDFSTLNGPQAFVREDHSSPVVTIALLFQGGRITEDEGNGGITELTLRSILYGTPKVSATQMAGDLDRLSANVEIINEPDFFGMTMSVLSGNAPAALRLLRDMVEEPAFRDADIERARAEQISALRLAMDKASERARALLFHSLFSGYSYGFPEHGVGESVAKMKPDQVRDWYSQTVKTQYPLIVIVGDTGGSALISEGVAGQFSRRDLSKAFQAKVPKNGPPSELAEARRCPVSIADIGLPGPKAGSDDVPVLDVIATLLSLSWDSLPNGSENQPLVPASVKVWAQPMLAAGAICASLGANAGDESRARGAFLALAQKLASKGVTEADSQSARAVAAFSVVNRLAQPRDRAIEYARAVFTKHEASYVDSYPDRLSKIRSLDVARVLSTYFKSAEVFAGVVRGTSSSPKPQPTPTPPPTAPGGAAISDAPAVASDHHID
jgi:predicted Zn-dependent peptidase